ncbi:hypothetical protein L3V83_15720 [Thiotrichales bacterium 19X7-9]|nr:hypothetical protein [Thiotrichales bacterium 19X7-9]
MSFGKFLSQAINNDQLDVLVLGESHHSADTGIKQLLKHNDVINESKRPIIILIEHQDIQTYSPTNLPHNLQGQQKKEVLQLLKTNAEIQGLENNQSNPFYELDHLYEKVSNVLIKKYGNNRKINEVLEKTQFKQSIIEKLKALDLYDSKVENLMDGEPAYDCFGIAMCKYAMSQQRIKIPNATFADKVAQVKKQNPSALVIACVGAEHIPSCSSTSEETLVDVGIEKRLEQYGLASSAVYVSTPCDSKTYTPESDGLEYGSITNVAYLDQPELHFYEDTSSNQSQSKTRLCSIL